MVIITGDIHGDVDRFGDSFMSEDIHAGDTVIITGDFGLVWDGSKHENQLLDDLSKKDYIIAFITGNHENFDLLMKYPERYWRGGRVKEIRTNIFLLLRGEIFLMEGNTYFCMGGAACHDICDGILDATDPEFDSDLKQMLQNHSLFRINHQTWWKEELPNRAEYDNAYAHLEANGWVVDYILTHCAPTSIQKIFGEAFYPRNELTDYLEGLLHKVHYRKWFFGHYHENRRLSNDMKLQYDSYTIIDPVEECNLSLSVEPELLDQVRPIFNHYGLSLEDTICWFLKWCVACPEKAASFLRSPERDVEEPQ